MCSETGSHLLVAQTCLDLNAPSSCLPSTGITCAWLNRNCDYYYFFLIYVCEPVPLVHCCPRPEECTSSSGMGITVSCKPPDVNAGN